jgi:hypothetical protein
MPDVIDANVMKRIVPSSLYFRQPSSKLLQDSCLLQRVYYCKMSALGFTDELCFIPVLWVGVQFIISQTRYELIERSGLD